MSAEDAAAAEPHAALALEGHVAVITLNRPDRRNSISPRMLDDIDAHLDTVERAGARVLVLRGAGGNFCAGADLRHVSGLLEEAPWRFADEFVPRVQRVMNRIEDLPLPVIAAVEGFCLAGGLELALCCDILLAARSARIGDGHSVYGFLPGSGGAYRLTRRVGAARAKYIAFSGEMFSAEEMAAMGLVTRLTEDAAFDGEVDALAGTFAARSPLGLRRMKELVTLSETSDRASGLAAERLASAAHTASFDMGEGLAAFAEKRAPVFRGR
jgi:enoyl-CoA hydratase/carnithine racemase